MEHAARLAVIEQKFRFSPEFQRFLHALLEVINKTLDYSCSVDVDSVSGLAGALTVEGTVEYLTYIGFSVDDRTITFSTRNDLKNLPLAKSAILNKLKLLGVESPGHHGAIRKVTSASSTKPPALPLLDTHNDFLQQIQRTLEFVTRYEDEELQFRARQCIPLVTLQTRAVNRLREQQRDIKMGSGEHENPYEMAVLSELVSWFKSTFFRWVNNPDCRVCEGKTTVYRQTVRRVGTETCRVEVFKCDGCLEYTEFIRYNDPGQLLRTREGRCGEWANCFTLLCRALGYDARYVVDTTDHVWCEVYDPYEQRWTHVDPCEAAVDTPLMYEHGWGKKLQYVIAYSRDDVQDVTWRYSSHHAEVRMRRNLCSERELVDTLMTLREAKHRHLTAARRDYLLRRCVCELAEMTVEKKPSDYESKGRISGSEAWRKQRGEYGSARHSWKLDTEGEHRVQYCPVEDEYVTLRPDGDIGTLPRWQHGVWECDNMRRNVESDWKMVYIARMNGSEPGSITWKLEAGGGMRIKQVTVSQTTQVFHSGSIEWSVSIDDGEFTVLQFDKAGGEQVATSCQDCRTVSLRATLSGGAGDTSWQHAQLFRLPLASKHAALDIRASVQ